MAISESELISFLQSAIRSTASRLRISDVDWKTPDELLKDIQSSDEAVHKLLHEFLLAYTECYKDWSPANIEKRNAARKAIIDKLADL